MFFFRNKKNVIPLVDFKVMVSCVRAFIDDALHVVHGLPTWLKNGFFVFVERQHTAEDN
jgi:hypothetical protein